MKDSLYFKGFQVKGEEHSESGRVQFACPEDGASAQFVCAPFPRQPTKLRATLLYIPSASSAPHSTPTPQPAPKPARSNTGAALNLSTFLPTALISTSIVFPTTIYLAFIDNPCYTRRSPKRKTGTNMDTLSKNNYQDLDTAPEYCSVPGGDAPFQSGAHTQSVSQHSTLALQEASRDAETFGDNADVAPGYGLRHEMTFNHGYYQPTEGAGLPTPGGCSTHAGSSPGHLNIPDSSPIFADTVLSENVLKRFLFAKNQRQRPIPAPNAESSGLGGYNRPTTGTSKVGDFVGCGAGAMVIENARLEDTYDQFGNPVRGESSSQFQNMNPSYNTPSGISNKYMAPIPSSASPIPPSFEPHGSRGHGVAIKDPASSPCNRQAPPFPLPVGQDCGEGSGFLTEQLIPLHSFSPEKLVPRYTTDGSTSSPQQHIPSKEKLGPIVIYTGGICHSGAAGASQELHSVERAGEMAISNYFKPSVQEFIARQSAKARPRPFHWRTQCHWAKNFTGEGLRGCRYGRGCLYGHDGDVYEDNLSVYYTFENGRICPNYVSPATPGPSLGVQVPCSPSYVAADTNPQSQEFNAGQSNQDLGVAKASRPHHPPGHSYASKRNAPVLPLTFRLPPAPQHEVPGHDQFVSHVPQHEMSGHDQLATYTPENEMSGHDQPLLHGSLHEMSGHDQVVPYTPQNEMADRDQLAIFTGASVTEGDPQFRLEPLVRAEDYLKYLHWLESHTSGGTVVGLVPSELVNGPGHA
ncbi:hypothetical protein HOY82DRAFT_588782 [Tuber indicum]|nr:hypothetical protein HOY82DRAFT_588782 [Tuber indicum]